VDHGAATPSLVADMHCPRAGNAREITILDTRNGPTGTKNLPEVVREASWNTLANLLEASELVLIELNGFL